MTQGGRGKSFVAVVVALALLVGAGYLADRWVGSEIESRTEAAILENVPGLEADLHAELGGGLAIPQLIAGTIDEFTVTAPDATLDGLTLTDVHVTASDVRFRGATRVASLHATATIPTETVLIALQRQVDLPEGVTLELLDGEIAAVATVLGVRLAAYVRLVPQARAVTIEIDRLDLGGATVSASDIPIDLNALLGVTAVDLDMLPQGIELTDLQVTPTGIDLVLDGTDVSV